MGAARFAIWSFECDVSVGETPPVNMVNCHCSRVCWRSYLIVFWYIWTNIFLVTNLFDPSIFSLVFLFQTSTDQMLWRQVRHHWTQRVHPTLEPLGARQQDGAQVHQVTCWRSVMVTVTSCRWHLWVKLWKQKDKKTGLAENRSFWTFSMFFFLHFFPFFFFARYNMMRCINQQEELQKVMELTFVNLSSRLEPWKADGKMVRPFAEILDYCTVPWKVQPDWKTSNIFRTKSPTVKFVTLPVHFMRPKGELQIGFQPHTQRGHSILQRRIIISLRRPFRKMWRHSCLSALLSKKTSALALSHLFWSRELAYLMESPLRPPRGEIFPFLGHFQRLPSRHRRVFRPRNEGSTPVRSLSTCTSFGQF